MEYIEAQALRVFLTVAWPLRPGEEVWPKLFTGINAINLSQALRGRKYVRCLGVGDSNTPHVHLLLTEAGAAKVAEVADRKRIAGMTLCQKDISDPQDLLGYFFDHNFIPLYRRYDRPPRIRILTGSRGMPCGFPRPLPKQEESHE